MIINTVTAVMSFTVNKLFSKTRALIAICVLSIVILMLLSKNYPNRYTKILHVHTGLPAETNRTLRTDQIIDEINLSDTQDYTINISYAPICSHMQRIAAVRRICKETDLVHKTKQRNPGLMVQPEYNVAYCEISKIGSTNMKRVFATSTKKGRNLPKNFKTNWHNGRFLKKMGMTSDKGLNSRIHGLTKFFIVRHPFDRLISAYNSKLGPVSPGNGGYGALSKRIIKINNPNINGNSTRNRATFAEFVHALAARAISRRNNHWIPFATFCNPCEVEYDYILRVESMTHDAILIMEKLHLNATHVDQTNYSTNARLRYKDPAIIMGGKPYAVLKRLDAFRDVPKADMDILYKIYAMDLMLYGYSFDHESLSPGCEFTEEKCC